MKEQLGLFEIGEGKGINNTLPIPNEWAELLNSKIIKRTSSLVKTINKERKTKTIYPEEDEVFKAFELLPQDIKVVIIGQDPYHNGNANGRAFACKKFPSPSLVQIFGAISPHYLRLKDSKLENWQEQGILLLNTCLTVEKAKPFSHNLYGWNRFIIPLIQSFSKEYKEVIYMLWGLSAKKLEGSIDKEDNLILVSTHPVYAARENRQWVCNHFEVANKYLRLKGKTKITW